jgi:AcrR family transcriptional regulator
VPAKPQHPLKPRKRLVQARSEATVSALFEASIQVLLAVGYRKFTTTRVAERAGVSVGSLYQYFPNREALITSVIERYLGGLRATVEQRCRELRGCKLDHQVKGLVDAVIAANGRISRSRARCMNRLPISAARNSSAPQPSRLPAPSPTFCAAAPTRPFAMSIASPC